MIVLAKCIVCGKTGVCLCEACKQENDIENLCNKLIEYNVGSGENLLWDQIASELNSQDNLKNIVFFISKYLPSPKKEFFEILSISSGKAYIPKASRPWFYEIYENMNFENGLKELHIDLSDTQKKQFVDFYEMLVRLFELGKMRRYEP